MNEATVTISKQKLEEILEKLESCVKILHGEEK